MRVDRLIGGDRIVLLLLLFLSFFLKPILANCGFRMFFFILARLLVAVCAVIFDCLAGRFNCMKVEFLN